MDIKKIKTYSRWFLSIGAVQYVLLTTIAMLFYPGGSNADPIGGPYTEGYTFFGNYFSDLGRTLAINGMVNPIASALYYIANILYALSLIPFFLTIASEFSGKGQGKGAGKAAAVFGLIAGLGTLTYAITPSDLLPMAHNLGVAFGYLGTFFAILFLGLAMRKKGDEMKPEGTVLMILAGIFLVTLVIGGVLVTVFMTMLMQKTGKYLTMAIFIIEGYRWKKLC